MWRFWKRRPRTIVLGQQLADARAMEERRLATNPGPSPMPAERYGREEAEYLGSFNPVELDTVLAQFVRGAASLDAAAREEMRRSITMDDFYTLLTFARRRALFAMRNRSVEPLSDAVNTIALIELARVDYRDVMTGLAILGQAALRVAGDTRELLKRASALAETGVAQLMAEFAGRSFDEERLRGMSGLTVVELKYGLDLMQFGFCPYSPSFDLPSLMIEMAELLQADRYRVNGIQIATDLPPFWLRAAGEKAVQKALRGTKAGASLSGSLRPEVDPTHESQSLTAFVVEMQRAEQAQTLLEMSRIGDPGYASLGCAQGPLFCLVVARSWIQGAASYETTSTLARLEPGIAEVMRAHGSHCAPS